MLKKTETIVEERIVERSTCFGLYVSTLSLEYFLKLKKIKLEFISKNEEKRKILRSRKVTASEIEPKMFLFSFHLKLFKLMIRQCKVNKPLRRGIVSVLKSSMSKQVI